MAKGKIGTITEDFDTSICKKYYSVVIWFEEEPDLKLGDCEVKQ